MTTESLKPKIWVPGDWNAFFGFGTNILVNLMVLTTLLRFVIKMPDAIVFGRILPATGLMLCLSTMYYAWLAYRRKSDHGAQLPRRRDRAVRLRSLRRACAGADADARRPR